jgi:ABC-type multidrug transport system fused ATPase/permease subunit
MTGKEGATAGRGVDDEMVAGSWTAMLTALVRPHASALLVVLMLMLVQSVATLLQPWFSGVIANRLILGEGFGLLLWLLFGLVAAQALLGYLVGLQLQKVSGMLVATTGAQVYAHLQGLPLAWHQERQRGDVLALLTGDIARLAGYVTGTVIPLAPLLFTLVGALAMMFALAPVIAIAVAVLMPVFFLALKFAGRWLRPLGFASTQAWADQSAMAEQNLEMLPVIKAFAAEDREALDYRRQAHEVFLASFRQARLQGAINPVVHVVGAGVVLLLLGVAGSLIVRDEMSVGALVSLFLYGLVLISPVSQLARVYGDTHVALGTMQRLRDALAVPPEVDTGSVDALPRDGDIHYRAVDFAYPGREPLFRGFDLRIRAHETVALTGVNGAGKSTLVHLLLRLLEPQSGQITIGGIDIHDFRLAALRGQVGLVAQQVMLFNATVAENIAYGRADAGQEAIERAAGAARAHDFIAALPDGYDTMIGDQGVKLSGGQKQRIALARALLKDPPILILDEATAMFDPAGEQEFIAQCGDVLKERTVILITHRPASLALADRVLRLENGRLVPVPAGADHATVTSGKL